MDNLSKYQTIAINKGGLLLSTSTSYRKKLQWQCIEGHVFWLTPYKVERKGKWCNKCGSSNGERNIRKILRENNIYFIPQYILPCLNNRKYDFYFIYNGQKFLLEFDGEQHFRYVRKYHKSKSKFLECQIIDRVKTFAAWSSGYRFIRIDYTQIDHIKYHLISAINCNAIVYLSNPELYKYITNENITSQQFARFS